MAIFRKKYRDAEGNEKRAKTWTLEYVRDGQVYRVSLGVKNKAAAQMRAAAILKAFEDGGARRAKLASASPRELVVEHVAEMRRLGRDEAYVRHTEKRLLFMVEGATKLAHLTPERIRERLAALNSEGTLTARTVNYYRVSLLCFFSALVKDGRWAENPCLAVPRSREGEPTRTRRALSAVELDRLLATAPSPRREIYRLAATTGLRRGEIDALAWRDVDLAAATLTVRRTSSKNRKEETLALPPGTVEALESIRPEKVEDVRVFPAGVPRVEVLETDLEVAGIAPDTDEGVIDFHALRGTFATLLARANVPLVLAQRLMRHSTPALTANIYTKLELHDGRAAVAKIDPAGSGSLGVKLGGGALPLRTLPGLTVTSPKTEQTDLAGNNEDGSAAAKAV